MLGKENLEKVISIGFLNDKIEENISFYQKYFDVVLTKEDATFYEVEKIIKRREEMKK